MSSPDNQPRMQSIIKHDRVRVGEIEGNIPSALPAHAGVLSAAKNAARCKKSVQLLREKEIVHAVEVRCSCGEVTVVEFEYGPPAG